MATSPSVLPVTSDADADALLATDPLALLIGMLLDQQVPMEWAFRGPLTLQERLGAPLDARRIAAMPEADVEAVFRAKPAMHRYPGSMAKRTHDLCRHIVDEYDGDTAAIWTGVDSGAELLRRVRALPGFGDEKARIFVALLAKRRSVRPPGWEDAAKPFSDAVPRSVADIDSPETMARVREWKRVQKAQGKTKAD